MGAILAAIASVFKGKPPETPIKNPCVRLGNIAKNNFRGILGVLGAIIMFPLIVSIRQNKTCLAWSWAVMAWFLLMQPVHVPVVGLMPVFLFPCLGIMMSDDTTKSYFNGGLGLFVLGGYMTMILNCSGFCERALLRIVCPSNKVKLTKAKMLLRFSFAAFLLSMISNRLMVTTHLMTYLTGPLINLQSAKIPTEIDYKKFRYVLANAVAVSSSLGSLSIITSSYPILAMNAIYEEAFFKLILSDSFNFLQYLIIALPMTISMYLLNLLYFFIYIKILKKDISVVSQASIRSSIFKYKDNVPKKVTLHEWMTLFFLFAFYILCIFRWSIILNSLLKSMGWSDFARAPNLMSNNFPRILDATPAAIFAILTSILPKGFGFFKYMKPGIKKSQLPVSKPESAILFWRIIDKHLAYAYILLIGAGIALNKAIIRTKMPVYNMGNFMTYNAYVMGVYIIAFIQTVLCNIMSSIGALIVFLPLALHSVPPITSDFAKNNFAVFLQWKDKIPHIALICGMASSFGFAAPFLNTPQYFVKSIAKVPLLQQIKVTIPSIILCYIALVCSVGTDMFSQIFKEPYMVTKEKSNGTTTTTTLA